MVILKTWVAERSGWYLIKHGSQREAWVVLLKIWVAERDLGGTSHKAWVAERGLGGTS